MKNLNLGHLVYPVLSIAILVVAWRWSYDVRNKRVVDVQPDRWQQVKESFPMPEAFQTLAMESGSVLEAVIDANPFSPQRKQPIEQAQSGHSDGVQSQESTSPKFVYRGRISMGSAKRAIIENSKEGKTYFLQVGQEVEGYKVLDITETTVVLLSVFSKEPITINLNQ